MKSIIFGDKAFGCKNKENLLDAFFRNKIEVPFSCRNGTCQACLVRVLDGDFNKESQIGLSEALVSAGHVLSCKCVPISNLKLARSSLTDLYHNAEIVSLEKLSSNIMLVGVNPKNDLIVYKPGQFINIKSEVDDKVRSYSITSIYGHDSAVEFHVQKIASGVFSQWVFNHAQLGDCFHVRYPLGACFASNERQVRGKLLVATGSGLGAVLAIARSELSSGYSGPVKLIHASKNDSGLYGHDMLLKLSKKYQNFEFCRHVTEQKSSVEHIVFKAIEDSSYVVDVCLKGWEVYLYGNPKMVESMTKMAVAYGCKEKSIRSDAFEYAKKAEIAKVTRNNINDMEYVEEKKRIFEPDPAMWKALDEGRLLNKILNHFYDKVLQDSWLSPFFKGVTKDHIVGKQYAFFNQIYTGKDCYFGDRPRNAHHWMIISDDLFDYREQLFEESCRYCGLEDPYLSQILAFHESYRYVIVKDKMWPRINNGQVKPVKGFEDMVLDIGSICDGCHREIKAGEKVHYHDLTGEMFCCQC